MSKCIRCGADAAYKRICSGCMGRYIDMGTEVFNLATDLYGKHSIETDVQFKQLRKRLEKLWRKDKKKYHSEIQRLKTNGGIL